MGQNVAVSIELHILLKISMYITLGGMDFIFVASNMKNSSQLDNIILFPMYLLFVDESCYSLQETVQRTSDYNQCVHCFKFEREVYKTITFLKINP